MRERMRLLRFNRKLSKEQLDNVADSLDNKGIGVLVIDGEIDGEIFLNNLMIGFIMNLYEEGFSEGLVIINNIDECSIEVQNAVSHYIKSLDNLKFIMTTTNTGKVSYELLCMEDSDCNNLI